MCSLDSGYVPEPRQEAGPEATEYTLNNMKEQTQCSAQMQQPPRNLCINSCTAQLT